MRLGSDLSVNGKVHFAASNTYMQYSGSNELDFINGGNRGMSISSTGGVLHGTWQAETTVSTSDRRLKHSIVPLYRAIAESAPAESTAVPPEGQRSAISERNAAVGWVLRELRPVSFRFKHGPEAKTVRYGFVAQELQQTLPSLVRGTEEKHLSVVYQDLIALLTLAAQVLQDKVKEQELRLGEQDLRLNAQEDALSVMMKHIRALDEKIEQRKRGPATP